MIEASTCVLRRAHFNHVIVARRRGERGEGRGENKGRKAEGIGGALVSCREVDVVAVLLCLGMLALHLAFASLHKRSASAFRFALSFSGGKVRLRL